MLGINIPSNFPFHLITSYKRQSMIDETQIVFEKISNKFTDTKVLI